MSASLHGAYDLARAGYRVTCNYAVAETPTGCSCSNPECKKPGKHPRGGHTNSTSDPAVIRGWETKYRGAFNVGIDLESSGLIDWAPDSPEWLAEGERRGIPDGALRWQSGSGEGHEHVVMRRPDGCPITKINRSGEFDLIVNGQAAAPPSVSSKGAYTWISERIIPVAELPEAPAWMVALLHAEGAKREPAHESSGSVEVDGDESEPPIELTGDELLTWQGAKPKITSDGVLDRSASLVKVARILYDHKMTRAWIVPILRQRDHALDWHKYCCGRTDSEKRYHAIVSLVERAGRRAPEPIPVFGDRADDEPTPAGACGGCRERERIIHGMRAVLQDQRLKPAARLAGIGLAFTCTAKEQQRGLKPGAEIPIHAESLAKDAGLPRRTLDTNTAPLEPLGLIRKRVINVQQVKPGGPVPIGEYKKQTIVKMPGATLAERLELIAGTEKEERTKPGGWQPRRCPDHPKSAILAQTTYICAECGQPTYRAEAHIAVKADTEADAGVNGRNGHTATSRPGQNGHTGEAAAEEASTGTAEANGHSGHLDEADTAFVASLHGIRAEVYRLADRAGFPMVRCAGREIGPGCDDWLRWIEDEHIDGAVRTVAAILQMRVQEAP